MQTRLYAVVPDSQVRTAVVTNTHTVRASDGPQGCVDEHQMCLTREQWSSKVACASRIHRQTANRWYSLHFCPKLHRAIFADQLLLFHGLGALAIYPAVCAARRGYSSTAIIVKSSLSETHLWAHTPQTIWSGLGACACPLSNYVP